MNDLIKQLMDYSFSQAPNQQGPSGFLFFIFLLLTAVTTIWVSYFVFDFFKGTLDSFVRWRSNVADSNAKSKKNDLLPVVKDGMADIHVDISNMKKELETMADFLSKSKPL